MSRWLSCLSLSICLGGGLLLTATALARADDLDAHQIMVLNDRARRADSEQVNLVMKLINERGKERSREILQATRTEDDGQQQILIRFLSPADVAGTGFLTHEHADREDDQWLYLPALHRVRRISASDQANSFMGSDFAFEDLGNEELESYSYTLLGNEECPDGGSCYVIEAVPSTEEERRESGYSKRKMWIGKEHYLATRVEYTDKKGEPSKVLLSSDIRLLPEAGKWRAHNAEMRNLKTGHKTIILFDHYTFGVSIDNDLFTVRGLEQGR